MNAELDAECRLSKADFTRLAQFVTAELGIKMPESKLSLVQSRVLRRSRELGLGSVEKYAEYLFKSDQTEQERIHFIDAITTNKTDFFREPDHFRYLTGTALPALGRSNSIVRNGRLKVWSVGCSTGEEPYTLAMVLSEYAQKQTGFDFAILATDVSTRVLAKARAGIYEKSLIGPIPDGLRRQYLMRSTSPQSTQVRIVPALRSKVSFHRLNLMLEQYPVKDMFEVIFFRNVLIYFDSPTQAAVVRKICRNLVPGGYLFLGHSESLAGLDTPVAQVETAVFRKPH